MNIQLNYIEKKILNLKGVVYIGSPLGNKEDAEERFIDLKVRGKYVVFAINASSEDYLEGDWRTFICGMILEKEWDEEYILQDINNLLAEEKEILGTVKTDFGFIGIYNEQKCYNWESGPFDNVVMHGYIKNKEFNDIYIETAGCKEDNTEVYKFKSGFALITKPNYEKIELLSNTDEKGKEKVIIVKDFNERSLEYIENKEVTELMESWLEKMNLELKEEELNSNTVITLVSKNNNKTVQLNCKDEGLNRNYLVQFEKPGKCNKGASLYELYKTLYYTSRHSMYTHLLADDRRIDVNLPEIVGETIRHKKDKTISR